nr:MAG TPA: hypothetical protein [Crassvirales sp.]
MTVKVDELGNVITYRDNSGKTLDSETIEGLIKDPQRDPQKEESLWQFIDNNLAIGVSYDIDLRNALKTYLGDRTV